VTRDAMTIKGKTYIAEAFEQARLFQLAGV
jgi:hypothetical protein